MVRLVILTGINQKNRMSSYIECKSCGKKFVGHSNVYGKICTGCGSFIEPDSEPEFVRKNKEINKENQNKVREALKKSEENKNGN